jgi:EAL domain-containing protein (putative c-di-GMP-specific phosphodiesterase class I)
MASKSIFSSLIRDQDGTWSTAYGPFILKSALQPIFRKLADGRLDIDSFEGLVRAYRADEAVSPAEFFALIEPEDIEAIDSILRTMHTLNIGNMERSRARIFVNFHPGLFREPGKMRQEVERMRLAAHEADISPDRIVCEVSERNAATSRLAIDFTEHMRAMGFRVAIDDYGAGDSDIERVKMMKPDYVKFEAGWVRDFMHNSAGAALLRVIVSQFREDGIQPIFEALEEMWQVDLCEELGVTLMQGYALARPELAPTTFDERFPELTGIARQVSLRPNREMAHQPPFQPVPQQDPRGLRPVKAFGKRRS